MISKEKPMGLTDSWNKGYNFAVSMVGLMSITYSTEVSLVI